MWRDGRIFSSIDRSGCGKRYFLVVDLGRHFTISLKPLFHPLCYTGGYAFILSPSIKVNFSNADLARLHFQFYHPIIYKLFQFLQRASPERATKRIKNTIQRVPGAFSAFRQYHTPPFLFGSILPPDKLIFNRKLWIYLVWLSLHQISGQLFWNVG